MSDHPSGIECIQVTERMNFCIGSAVERLWQASQKKYAIEDLKKARWYIDREIERLEKEAKGTSEPSVPVSPDSKLHSFYGREEAAMKAARVSRKVWESLDSSTRDFWRRKVEEEAP